MLSPRSQISSAKGSTRPPSSAPHGVDDDHIGVSHHNLFAACLPRWLDNNQLFSVFAAFEPTSATIMMDVNTGRSKGFGFVLFRSDEEGQRALNALNGKSVSCGGGTFAMHLSPSKYDGFAACAESTRIYLRNVPISTSASTIGAHFGAIGTLVSLDLRPDTRRCSWLVSLEFATIADAKAAITHSHGRYLFPAHPPLPAPVMAKFADTVEVKVQRRMRRCEERGVAPPDSAVRMQSPPPPYEACGLSDAGSVESRPPSPQIEDVASRLRFRHEPYGNAGYVVLPL